MVGVHLSLRLFMSKKKKKKKILKIPVISHYTSLEYCTAKRRRRGKKKLNNKNQIKNKATQSNCLHKAEKKYYCTLHKNMSHFIKLYKFVN